jgi:epoxyqueuosine reductase
MVNTPSSEEILKIAGHAAASEGLTFFGATDLDVRQDYEKFSSWLKEGRNASMAWMNNHPEIRQKPELLLPGAQRAFIFGFPYWLGDKWTFKPDDEAPKIAQYARISDYHRFLVVKLKNVQKKLEALSNDEVTWRIAVDSAPLLERALAAAAGNGFIGKNTCFIHHQKGSFFLLGEILTTLSFDIAKARKNNLTHIERTSSGGCGTCRRCQVHCPTGALDSDYKIDSRKCLSYWTIENRGLIPIEFWPWVARYLFGCDICQLVCPYNRNIQVADEAKRLIRVSSTPDLIEIATMDQDYYEKNFGGTPMTRAKKSGLRRNALIAAVVKNDPRIWPLLANLEDEDDSIIRGTVAQIPSFLKTKSP